MKHFEINIEGEGVEIALGKLSDEDIEKIETCVKEEGINKKDLFTDYESFLEDYDLNYWYDYDDLLHETGVFPNDTHITITDLQNKKVLIDKKLSSIRNIITTKEETKIEIDNTSHLFSISTDRGSFFCGKISIEDNEEFDITKFEIIKETILINNCNGNYYKTEIISNVLYNGNEFSESNDADRKYLDVEILNFNMLKILNVLSDMFDDDDDDSDELEDDK